MVHKNHLSVLSSLVLVTALIFASSPVEAFGRLEQKLVVWDDPFTPPQMKASCAKWAKGKWPWGGGWKTCIGHKYQWRKMRRELWVVVDGVDGIDERKLQAVIKETIEETAFRQAALAILTKGASLSTLEADLKVTLVRRLGEKVRNAVRLENRGGWTKWS